MLGEGLQKIITHVKDLMSRVVNSKSKTFLAFCFCFMAGAGVASLGDWVAKTPSSVLPLIGGGSQSTALLSPIRGETERGVSFAVSISLYLYISFFILISSAILFWHKPKIRFLVLCSLSLLLGVWRFVITIPNITPDRIEYYVGKHVQAAGVITAEPDTSMTNAKYVVSISNIKEGQLAKDVSGKVLVISRLYPTFNYGDQIKFDCQLRAPENLDGSSFRYDKYLAKEGIWAVCSFPKSIVIASEERARQSLRQEQNGEIATSVAARLPPRNDSLAPKVWVIKKIFLLKSHIQSKIENLWSEPESSLMQGLLYGSKSGLPKEIIDDFNKTGVSHIIAVSGFNITIIVTALMFMLIRLGLWRQHAYWAVVGFIILFIIFTGATGSVVRAGIMGFLVLTAQQLGRLSRIGNVLVFTAAVMTIANPYVLVWDAGFQLSFLATLGLVYISPVLESVIARSETTKQSPHHDHQGEIAASLTSFAPRNDNVGQAFHSAWNFIREPLLQTLSAILATLPIILYQFGRLSIVAPLVNVLILWTVPWLMLIGFTAIIFGFIFFPLGQLVAWIAYFGLRYVIMVVEWFGNQPWSAVQFQVPWWGMAGMYVGFIIVIARRSKATTKQSPLCGKTNDRV